MQAAGGKALQIRDRALHRRRYLVSAPLHTAQDDACSVECPCGRGLGPANKHPQQALHHAQHVTMRLADDGLQQDITVQLMGSDLVDRLTPGCHAELLVQVVPELQPSGTAGPAKAHMRLHVMNALALSAPVLRARQLQCSRALAGAFAGEPALLWQELLDLAAAAAGKQSILVEASVTWYMLLTALLSAVSIGEEQRAAKVPGHQSHRCQVRGTMFTMLMVQE